MKISLIHNPAAGDEAQLSANKLVRMIRKAGHKVKYFSSKDKGWKKALKKSCDIVVVAGGDGTVGRVARNLVDSRTPIAVLPMGTANNIANTLGVAGKGFEDLISGWNSARCVNFDVGVAKGPWGLRHFIEGFGVGLFAETMFRIKNGQHPHVSRSDNPEDEISASLNLLQKQLSSYPAKEMTVRLDGKDLTGGYYMLEVLNIRYIGPNLDLVPRAQINDGLLDVVFLRKGEQAKLRQYISDCINKRRSRPNLMIRQGRHLQVEWKSTPVHIDDMPWPEDKATKHALSAAIDIKIDPGALVFLKMSK